MVVVALFIFCYIMCVINNLDCNQVMIVLLVMAGREMCRVVTDQVIWSIKWSFLLCVCVDGVDVLLTGTLDVLPRWHIVQHSTSLI